VEKSNAVLWRFFVQAAFRRNFWQAKACAVHVATTLYQELRHGLERIPFEIVSNTYAGAGLQGSVSWPMGE
jgi:hypothetical protein